MTSTLEISCILDTSDPMATLGFEAWIDDSKVADIDHVQNKQIISIKLTETDGDHVLRFIMKNKSVDLTTVDESGNILKDARLSITDLTFDEIKLGQIFVDHAVYTHDFNGTAHQTTERFFGELGCNGTVSLNFTSPLYIWLLENM